MKRKVALVLSSGGARGIAHIGVIRELEADGFEITSVAGTSMGALIGGVYAAGKLDEFEKWLTSLSRFEMFNLFNLSVRSKGLVKIDKALKEMQKFIPDRKIEELPVSYVAVATDISKNREVVFTEGDLFYAIKASVSIPMLITPVQEENNIFVDGGLMNPVPVNRVKRTEGDILVAVNANAFASPDSLEALNSIELNDLGSNIFNNENKKPKSGYFDLLVKASAIMMNRIMELTFKTTPPDMLVEIPREVCGVFDFSKASELIDTGRKIAKKSITGLQNENMND